VTSEQDLFELLGEHEVEFEIADATSLRADAWTCRFTPRSGFITFNLVPHGRSDVTVHGDLSSAQQRYALACVHRGANRLLVARYSADLQIPEGSDEVGTLAQRLAAAIDGEPLGGRALDPTYEVDLLPNDPAWDAHFVDRAAAHIWPVADESRSFRAEGAAYIASLQPDHRLQFMFDIPKPGEPEKPWGPWLFGATERAEGEARVVSSYLGGSMGEDVTQGWVVWYSPDLYYAMYDASRDATRVMRLPKPAEMLQHTPADPSWWVTLARALQFAETDTVGEVLFKGW
jgi:hypothetical protein